MIIRTTIIAIAVLALGCPSSPPQTPHTIHTTSDIELCDMNGDGAVGLDDIGILQDLGKSELALLCLDLQ